MRSHNKHPAKLAAAPTHLPTPPNTSSPTAPSPPSTRTKTPISVPDYTTATAQQLASIAAGVRAGDTTIVIQAPTYDTLWALSSILHESDPRAHVCPAGEATGLGSAPCAADPFEQYADALAGLCRRDFHHLRYGLTPPCAACDCPCTPRPARTLTLSMPTWMHDATRMFVAEVLTQQRGPLARILSPAELSALTLNAGPRPLPGGPEHAGYKNRRGGRGRREGRKPRALEKEADIQITHHPEHRACLVDGFEDDEREFERGGVEACAEPPVPEPRVPAPMAVPHVVFEVGYTQTYASLLADAADWLVASEGHIRLCIIVHIDDATIPAATIPAATAAPAPAPPSTPPQVPHQPPHDTPLGIAPPAAPPTTPPTAPPGPTSSPYSAISAYEATADAIPPDASTYIGPLTAFLELWEYDPASIGIAQRGERIPLIDNGTIAPRVAVPLRRADFGLPDAEEMVNVAAGALVETNWRRLPLFLGAARVADAYRRKMRLGKKRRADKRVREGAGGEGAETYVDGSKLAGGIGVVEAEGQTQVGGEPELPPLRRSGRKRKCVERL